MPKYEGAGGYGTCSTLNQDERQGRYYPHINILILEEHPYKLIRCFTCSKQWEASETKPLTCKKDEWKSAEEILKG
jgi:hypothetical protein